MQLLQSGGAAVTRPEVLISKRKQKEVRHEKMSKKKFLTVVFVIHFYRRGRPCQLLPLEDPAGNTVVRGTYIRVTQDRTAYNAGHRYDNTLTIKNMRSHL